MDVEQQVKAMCPGARVVGGHHGKVWIEDGAGQMLSDVQANGRREARRKKALYQALERLRQRPQLTIEEVYGSLDIR